MALKQERAEQTRRALLLAAAEVFDEFGYAGASITRILKRAGVTAGALYFHFGSKEDLAKAVMNSQPDTLVPLLAASGLQRLIDLTLVWSWQLQRDPLLRAGVRLTNEQASIGDSLNADPYEKFRGIMSSCLHEAREDGELQPGIEPTVVAEFVIAACTGMQMYSNVVSGRRDLPERTQQMWNLLLPGIAVPSVITRAEATPARGAAMMP
ncbi:TetR/AcrR family transcriptional regulator [Streptomyces anulatus]|uniref:ScbR family autoregulator-binding transcription factor n=1 Tax=Streptomyces TaxID=1883 RepID=UPI00067C9AA9|nr:MULTISPECIES: ScbR family autoregulator-binding transcription factor [Streptomyces]KND24624.1 branched-chain amino acid aminotransferase [Streptomyces europaeiscabiei]MDF9805426.1 AcrR family transcriptional regulator [Streptomyces sp. HB372]KPL31459.1 branched-chain amino acid aminotransferase [Streptomyces anulatus]KQX37073.1 branched-chain amino acid aminotransferase [Streptomyces sp. Root1295]KRA43863.1 branched-chain amino acid aminotransferase [Streptomyces sp. Root63]